MAAMAAAMTTAGLAAMSATPMLLGVTAGLRLRATAAVRRRPSMRR